MLQALRQNPNRRQVARTKFIPTPTKGWVVRNNVALGEPGTANILENFFPKADTVEVRAGFAEHSDTGETVPVNSLMAYHGTSTNKLFGVSNDTVYDVTSSTASATTVTGLASSKCIHVNFTTSGGHFLFFVNGEDTAKHYNGSVWATPSITGTTSDNFSHVNVYKSRLYFVVKNSLKFAYLPVGVVAGAASTYELGDLFTRGGTLVAMSTYTVDGGAGVDDYAVFVSSQGQVAMFSGSDPASDFSLVGVFDMARPLGNRCLGKLGADLYFNTEIGVLPLSQALKVDQAALNAIVITGNITPVINQVARLYKSNFGWQVIAYPKGSMAILNVPVSEGVQQQQFVMNTVTGAWCKFTGMNAACWELLDGALYFGGNDGKVYLADTAASDNGSNISADMQTYYESFKSQSNLKYWKQIRPIIYAQGTVQPKVSLNVDFVSSEPTGAIVAASSSNSAWGSMTWGSFTWSGGRTLNAKWRALTDKPGYVAAVRMKVQASGSGDPVLLQVNGFDVSYEIGGVM